MTSPLAPKCSNRAYGWTAWVFHCDLLTLCLSFALGQPPFLLSDQCFLLLMLQSPMFNIGGGTALSVVDSVQLPVCSTLETLSSF